MAVPLGSAPRTPANPAVAGGEAAPPPGPLPCVAGPTPAAVLAPGHPRANRRRFGCVAFVGHEITAAARLTITGGSISYVDTTCLFTVEGTFPIS